MSTQVMTQLIADYFKTQPFLLIVPDNMVGLMKGAPISMTALTTL